jgi:hypothetical protein
MPPWQMQIKGQNSRFPEFCQKIKIVCMRNLIGFFNLFGSVLRFTFVDGINKLCLQ